MNSKYLFCSGFIIACLAFSGCSNDSSSQTHSCPDGQSWNTDTEKCSPVPPEPFHCSLSSECPDGQSCINETCQITSGSCSSNEDCLNTETCLNNHCTPKSSNCSSDSECTNGKCVDGSCKADEFECVENDDCDGSLVCRDHLCKPECSSNDDCDGPLVCKSEHCVPECTEDTDCEPGRFCRESICTHECSVQEDCDAPKLCQNNVCIYECTEDAQCSDNKICRSNLCVPECQDNSDCDGALICKDTRCVPECTAAEDCTNDQVCVDQRCIPPCTSDEDCKMGNICKDKICIPDPLWCVIDNDCDNKDFYCDNNHCRDPKIKCYNDDECDGFLVCQENQCVPECRTEDDCSGGLICLNYRCLPECTDNTDCLAPKYCNSLRCTSECNSTSDCPHPYLCKEKQCVPECTQNSDCTDSLLCSNMQCVECTQDSDCGDDYKSCILNECKNSRDVRYPCLIQNDGPHIYKTNENYNAALNDDGSINLCKVGYHPSLNDLDANPELAECIPLFEARKYDFYGDGIDSNCDGYDYDLSTAIFVAGIAQGTETGDDSNSGVFDKESNKIKAQATLKTALSHLSQIITLPSGTLSYYPDIIVSTDITPDLLETLEIPNKDSDLTILSSLKSISSDKKSAFEEHSTLLKRMAADTTIKASDFAFYTEGSHPLENIRIFGGFTIDPLKKDNTLHWQQVSDDDFSSQKLVISNPEKDSYVLLKSEMDDASLSLSLNRFDMTIEAAGDAPLPGTTLIGMTCGKSGCKSLNLSHTRWHVNAPDGKSITETLEPGEAGIAGKPGDRGTDMSNYVETTWCPDSQQLCAEKPAAGIGGCGGHIRKLKDGNGDNSSNYDGSSGGYKGLNGKKGSDVENSSGALLASGGDGGKGLDAGIDYGGCDDDDDVDLTKGTGENGENGANGSNGSHRAFKLTLTPNADSTLYFASNYETLEALNGSDGAQGGGGGGGAAYHAFTSSYASAQGWISAGSGGNGGCGGKGGKAGGTGGSAIGIILTPTSSGKSSISFDDTQFIVKAGNGGMAQAGSDGGIGGIGGTSKGFASTGTFNYEVHCDKATAGGNGGNGGGGGAGAGGVAGQAVSYLLACNRTVTDICSDATPEIPCFNANSLSTLSNCGFAISSEFIRFSNPEKLGSATPGLTIADSIDNTPGSGSTPGSSTSTGQAALISSWIGSLQ